jgi:hypothetical protein
MELGRNAAKEQKTPQEALYFHHIILLWFNIILCCKKLSFDCGANIKKA